METLVYENTIKIVGIKFDNRINNLLKIIENGKNAKKLAPYLNTSIEKMKEINLNQLGEYDEQKLSDVKLEEGKFQNKPSIKVYINDYNNNYLEVGFIPQGKVKELKKYLNKDKYNIDITSYIVGGNFINIENNEVINRTLNYGIKLQIKITKKIK